MARPTGKETTVNHPPAVGTARVATTNLFPETLTSLDQIMAAPVGTIVRDSDGDTFERRPHGQWRGNSFPHAITDEALAVYLPLTVENHAELAGLELQGYRLGHLVRVLTNDYVLAVGRGERGVVERIVGPHLYIRFRGGMVVPLLTTEVEHVGGNGITVNARILTKAGLVGFVIGRAPGYIEPTWIVRLAGESSPWFGHSVPGHVIAESDLILV